MQKIFITGVPRSGKSTIAMAVINEAKKRGIKISGMVSPEIKQSTVRIGFKLIDIATQQEAVMASVNLKSKFKVGKYSVDVDAIDRISGLFAGSLQGCRLVVIDEIGKMELFSEVFKRVVGLALKTNANSLFVVHKSLVGEYARGGSLVEVNRDIASEQISELISELF